MRYRNYIRIKAFCDSCGKNNIQIAKSFDIEKAKKVMSEIYTCGGYRHVECLLGRQKNAGIGNRT